jgi:MYXO-CTERM domain-containing protein
VRTKAPMRRRFLWPPFVLLALTLAALWQASAASAAGEPIFGCGHVHTGKAEFDPYAEAPKQGLPPDGGPPPIAIGDSTMLLPIPELNKVGFDVNALGCRGFKQSIWVARDMRNRGVLPKLILINAYGNGGVDNDLIKFALKVIGPNRTLALVTAYNADTGEPPAPDTDVFVQAAKDHPDQIKLLDWVSYSLPHHKIEPEPGAWFLPDLFHPNFIGAHEYANFLAQVLPGGPPSEAKKSSDDEGTTWWHFALGGAVLLAAVSLFAVRRRRA